MGAISLSRKPADHAFHVGRDLASGSLDDQLQGLAPNAIEFFGVGLVLALYGVAATDGYALVGFVNIIGPIIFTITVAFAAFRLTQNNIHAIWTPLFWYRVAMVTYMGVGSVLISFYNADTRDLIATLFAFSPEELLKFNTVNALFHMCALGVSWVVIRIYGSSRNPLTSERLAIDTCRIPLKTVGLVFLSVGLLTNYLVIYPAALGIINLTYPTR